MRTEVMFDNLTNWNDSIPYLAREIRSLVSYVTNVMQRHITIDINEPLLSKDNQVNVTLSVTKTERNVVAAMMNESKFVGKLNEAIDRYWQNSFSYGIMVSRASDPVITPHSGKIAQFDLFDDLNFYLHCLYAKNVLLNSTENSSTADVDVTEASVHTENETNSTADDSPASMDNETSESPTETWDSGSVTPQDTTVTLNITKIDGNGTKDSSEQDILETEGSGEIDKVTADSGKDILATRKSGSGSENPLSAGTGSITGKSAPPNRASIQNDVSKATVATDIKNINKATTAADGNAASKKPKSIIYYHIIHLIVNIKFLNLKIMYSN